jgi:hypothetical protein
MKKKNFPVCCDELRFPKRFFYYGCENVGDIPQICENNASRRRSRGGFNKDSSAVFAATLAALDEDHMVKTV